MTDVLGYVKVNFDRMSMVGYDRMISDKVKYDIGPLVVISVIGCCMILVVMSSYDWLRYGMIPVFMSSYDGLR